MSWSGGKDSALALHELQQNPSYHVVALMTSLAAEFRRISHHGVREELLDAQAEAIGRLENALPDGHTTVAYSKSYRPELTRAASTANSIHSCMMVPVFSGRCALRSARLS
jgi:diphthamide synthase (EF-2-diphthine--ammonia ligase)